MDMHQGHDHMNMNGTAHDHAGMSHSGHGMDHSMHMMNTYFTTAYKNYPVLFRTLTATTAGQAFGIFLLFFVASFLTKGLEFARNYLELKVWNNPNYQVPALTIVIEECACDGDLDKVSEAGEATTPMGTHEKLSAFTVLTRDVTRVILCFMSELFRYSMMLVAMSFSLVYFFAVVLGMAFGRFFFEKLSDKLNIRPGGNDFQGHH